MDRLRRQPRANERILGLLPGDVFVHRNVANVVVHSDLNALSVIQFAIDMLKVQHIMEKRVGPTAAAAWAALQNRRIGLADNWIRHVGRATSTAPGWTASPTRRWARLCEPERAGGRSTSRESPAVVQDAWARAPVGGGARLGLACATA